VMMILNEALQDLDFAWLVVCVSFWWSSRSWGWFQVLWSDLIHSERWAWDFTLEW